MHGEDTSDRCPRCGEGRLQRWAQLDEEQRELVRRLPGSATYEEAERMERHAWCPLCWYEEAGDGQRAA